VTLLGGEAAGSEWVLGGWEPEEHPWAPLFSAIFSHCAGLVEFRAFAGGGTAGRLFCDHRDIGRIRRFMLDHREHAVYFGVATRRDTASGKLENCRHLGALFTDVDFKVTPESDARARLSRCPFPPTCTVRSGGGLHAYWRLREPLELPDEAELAKRQLVRLATALGGDLGAAEPARVLRLPGSFNVKPEYGAPRLVEIEMAAA
jgi:hypothetical protein